MSSGPSASKSGGVKRIGGYRLEQRIGQGAMGVVFKATQLSMDRSVALKILPPKLAQKEAFTKRFIREAQSAGKLLHPNIVAAYEAGKSPEGYFFFAMEFVDGESLKQLIKRNGPLAEQRAVEVTLGVARGLAHAEKAGLIHRDVKPDNILIAKDGAPKLADFGLAKAPEDTSLTQMGGVVGTPAYISPEQARGEADLDVRSDIYSLGATFYHAVVGAQPFRADTVGTVIAKHLEEKAPVAHEQAEGVSPNTSAVIQKMMAKQPADRYQSADGLIEDLELLAQGHKPKAALARVGARKRVPRTKRGSPLLWATIGAACVLIAIGLGVAHFRGRDTKGAGERAAGKPSPNVRTAPRPKPRPSRPSPDGAQTATKAETPKPGAEAKPEQTPAALKTAIEHREGNPQDYKGQMERYQAIVTLYKGQPIEQAASKAIAEINAQWDAEARRELEAARRRAKPALAEERFGAASATLDAFPARLRNGKWDQELAKLRSSYLAAAHKAYGRVEDDVRKAASEGRWGDARKLCQRALSFGVPEISTSARAALQGIHSQERQTRTKDAYADEKAAYDKYWLELRALLRNGDMAKAGKLVAEAAKSYRVPAIQAKVREDQSDVKRLQSIPELAEKGLKTLRPGQTITVGGMRGAFRGCQGGKILLEMDKIKFAQPVERLSAVEKTEMAMRALDKRSPEGDVLLALLAIYGKGDDSPVAQEHIQSARKKGADVTHLEELMGRLEGIEAARARLALEGEAARFLAELGKLAGDKSWKELREGIATLHEKYGETELVRNSADRIQKLREAGMSWPRSRKGLVFLWPPLRRGKKGMDKPKRGPRRRPPWGYELEARGKAQIERGPLLGLDHGSFVAPMLDSVLLDRCMKTNELSIEAIFSARNLEQGGPARVISFSTDGSSRNFTLGQSERQLVLRLRVSISGVRENGHEVSMCALPGTERCHALVTYSPGRLVCHLNGEAKYLTDEVKGDFSIWRAHHFVIGDEYGEPRDWRGTIAGIALYNRALTDREAKLNFVAYQAKFASQPSRRD